MKLKNPFGTHEKWACTGAFQIEHLSSRIKTQSLVYGESQIETLPKIWNFRGISQMISKFSLLGRSPWQWHHHGTSGGLLVGCPAIHGNSTLQTKPIYVQGKQTCKKMRYSLQMPPLESPSRSNEHEKEWSP